MPIPANQGRDETIIALWERAAGLSGWRRDDALLAAIGTRSSGLGERNAALLAARGALFDRPWPLVSRCEACGADCEFEIDSTVLAEELTRMAPPASSRQIALAGQSAMLRAPAADDIRAIARYDDSHVAMKALLARCLTGDIDLSSINDGDLDELGEALEALDPGAVVRFELRCPDCDAEWQAAVDIGEAFWKELRHAAEQSLIQIDALARAYGWTEAEVLALSPTRRAAYLQLVGAS